MQLIKGVSKIRIREAQYLDNLDDYKGYLEIKQYSLKIFYM